MEPCWSRKAKNRPTFSELVSISLRVYDELLMIETAERIAEDDSNGCVICLSAPATNAFLPCGHKCVCAKDATLLPVDSPCPICRAPIQSNVRIFG
eukprot:m.10404 g.10404  ORF g.10404 m.10404 type:complete len:96 (+) comp6593_c1_seq1:2-289(+)